MPLLENENLDTFNVQGSNFQFTGARIDELGATEYTLVTIAVDITGSTYSFRDELRQCLITAVESCKSSPRSDNLLVRVVVFNSGVGVKELHGFVPLADIDPSHYDHFSPDDLTNLYDAAFSAVGALVDYGTQLMEDDYLTNGIVFIITDGVDNKSTQTPKAIASKIAKVRRNEALESLVTVLIGVNAADYQSYLEEFRTKADLDQYIDAGDASKGKLAKLAQFVSQSVSSQSQALGTGGPSQAISATI